MPTHVDLFSGILGFSVMSNKLGYTTTVTNDIDPYCTAVCQAKHPQAVHIPDVRDVRNVQADLITGGFPCPPFSKASQNSQKFEDERYLWPEMFRIIQESMPTHFIAENVSGLGSDTENPFFNDLATLRQHYRITLVTATASIVGAPHARQRLFAFGALNDARPSSLPFTVDNPWQKPFDGNIYTNVVENRTRRLQAYGNAVVPPLVHALFLAFIKYQHVDPWFTRQVEWTNIYGSPVVWHRTKNINGVLIPWSTLVIPTVPYYTPIRTDYKGSSDIGTRRNSISDQARQAARVDGVERKTVWANPDFVEWLMGFPKGWLD